MNYNTSNPYLEYNTNEEYRKNIREVFSMNCSQIDIIEDIDEESKDELLYDENTMNKEMDNIYNLTKDNNLFIHLYELAAARMFSTDRTIGECVLFSYDFFYLFHPCLCLFINYPEDFTENNSLYLQLLSKIK